MIESPDDRRTQLSPQLAMRVAILGGIALAMFAIVFFRLWFLQILSGDQYLAEASSNRVRTVVIQAPRGELTDRNGRVLVENRRAMAVVVSPPALPDDAAKRHAMYERLSRVLGRSTRPRACEFGSRRTRTYEVRQLMPVECKVEQNTAVLPYADVIVEPDAPRAVYTFVAERKQGFPGVETQQVFLRSYPEKTIGAHLFGTVGQINEGQLRQDHYRGVRGGTIVGQSGLEYTYDRYLRGENGAQRIQVDALGRARRRLRDIAPRAGNDLRLSIDLGLQKAGQDALQVGIAQGQAHGNPASGGAFVALDPRDGEVLAMGSAPDFDPNDFTRPITQRAYEAKFGEEAGEPLFNRATQGGFAVGSTFKPITAAAALSEGVISESTPYTDTGSWRSGAQVRRNAGGATYGTVAMRDAIKVSVDTYFYNLGAMLNSPAPGGGALQDWARRFGFGRPTAIDTGTDISGRVPDARWRAEIAELERRCRRRRRVESCGYSDMRGWTLGDNVSLAIGQGDFLASPLQLAVAYGAIENGGTVVRPHVGMQITDENGRVQQTIAPRPVRRFEIPGLETIRSGLLGSTSEPGGTSTDVFAGFPQQVYGKTGTAQRTGEPDQSWFVAYVPDPQRPIVVAAVIEDGGFGAEAAAPAVRLILSHWFGVSKRVVSGTSQTG
jgi:penicillin-binding protein 2